MIYETVDLYQYCSVPREGRTGGYLIVYAREREKEISVRIRPAMLVVPGGGYQNVSGREAEPVAMEYFREGYQAFVLRYSVYTAFPAPLIEAAMAMAYIRENAEELRIDRNHVAAIGFSAGAHLCGMLATLFADGAVKEALGKRAELVRPDAVVLSYGVLSTGEYTHGGSAEIISGGDSALREELSPDKCVKKDSVPAFLWHTTEDNCVPVKCSLLYANACIEAGVPCELHLFEQGWHGLSTLDGNVNCNLNYSENVLRNAAWIGLSLSWLKMRGFGLGELK